MGAHDRFDVIGFGALNVDLIYQTDSSTIANILKQARVGTETVGVREELYPVLQRLERQGGLRQKAGGGQAANTVVALSRMGFRCGYIGSVGDDEEGAFLLDSLESVDGTGIVKQGRSGICIIMLDETGERTNLVFPNTNDMMSYEQIDLSYASRADLLYFSSFAGDQPLDAQKRLAREVRDGCRIALDPGELYARRGLNALREIIERAEVIFATDTEIESLTGMEYQRGCQQVLATGARIVACKRGPRGSYVASQDAVFEIPALTVNVVDKTGAGDVYAAGFLAGLLKGASLEECARFATHVAAKSITGYGRSKYPDESDLIHLRVAGD